MRTRARRYGDDWVLDGSKMWITNGSIANVAVVWAQTDDRIRGFVVPTDTPGFSVADCALLAWMAFAVLTVNNGLGDLLTTVRWRSRNTGGTASLAKDAGSAVGEVLRLRRSGRVIAHALLAGATFFSVLVAAILA